MSFMLSFIMLNVWRITGSKMTLSIMGFIASLSTSIRCPNAEFCIFNYAEYHYVDS
jgi:hypothetical protein